MNKTQKGIILCVTYVITAIGLSGLLYWIGIKCYPGLSGPIYYFFHITSGFSISILFGLLLCMIIVLWKRRKNE